MRFYNENVVARGCIRRLRVALQVLEFRVIALAIAHESDFGETRCAQECLERRPVIQKLMAPAVKRLVQTEALLNCRGIRRPLVRPIVRFEDPVQVRSRKAKNSLVGKRSPTFAEETQ